MAATGLVDTTNIQNNHAGIERIQESEKAQALLKLVVDYRTHVQMYEYMPTWDILEFLQKLDNELNERYNKEVKDAERDKIKEQYFLLTKKKPFL
jgi:two-component sensor histidine kinase